MEGGLRTGKGRTLDKEKVKEGIAIKEKNNLVLTKGSKSGSLS